MSARVCALWRLLAVLGIAAILGAAAGLPLQADQTAGAVQVVDEPADVAIVLSARSPVSVTDLRLIQDQLQRVIAKGLPATVGVTIGRAAGSGVIVSKDGLVLTAGHVVGEFGRRATILLPDGRRLVGHTLGADHDADAGMIRIDGPPANLPYVDISNKDSELQPGEWVVTTGHPGGFVSDRSPPVRFGRVLFRGSDMICTDCKLVGGDSGGPLFNMHGEVVGIHSSIGPKITHNFHVPIAAFRKDWDRLIKGDVWGTDDGDEDPDRAVLGLAGKDENDHCKVSDVFAGMPAEKAGIKVGDVVAAVDGRAITTFDELARIIFFKEPGQKVRLTIERAQETLDIEVQLVAMGSLPHDRQKGPKDDK